MKERFSVGGMTCVNCSNAIEKSLKKTDGVLEVSVSLMEKSMVVDYDPEKITAEGIIAVVKKTGYSAKVFDSRGERGKNSDKAALRKRFFLSLAALVPLMYFSMLTMIGAPSFGDKADNIIQLVLTSVIIAVNYKFFVNGVKAVIARSPNMDTLVSLGAAASYAYSVAKTVMLFSGAPHAHAYYESAAMILTLVTLGKWLEEISKSKTGDEIEKLNKMIPGVAVVLRDGKQTEVPTDTLVTGDVVVLKAGDYVPVDGVVKEGAASVDNSAITGESLPTEAAEGSEISSGSIIREGYLLVTARSVGKDTLFSRIIEIVRTAGASKAPIQKVADKAAGVFVPVVTAIALVTFALWWIISGDVGRAVNYGISVLVISCPCALGLATPVAIMAATGRAAASGVLFKNAEAIQNACKINCVLLDKTATLTVGKPKVISFETYNGANEAEVRAVAYRLEEMSNHPLAECVREFLGGGDAEITDFEYAVGKGVKGESGGKKYFLGNISLLPERVRAEAEERGKKFEGTTALYFSDGEKLLAAFAVSDYIKEDSKEAIAKLNAAGIKTVMITGDNAGAAKRIAGQAGIDEFAAEVLPQDKYAIAEKYKKEGYFVAMVGDGINDSPALKAADVGIAMGTGTDVAIDSSDVVIVGGNMGGVCDTVSLGKKAMRIIKQNLFWAFFYNAVAIPVAAGALSFAGIGLTPSIASACMAASSLFVVTNAIRISKKNSSGGKNMKVTINGMECKHCAGRVEAALTALPGVKKVKVDLKKKTAAIKHDGTLDAEAVKKAVAEAGYEAVKVEED